MSKKSTKAPAADQQGTVDAKVIKALGHPLRQKILQELHQQVASPSQVAKEIDEPLSNVSYHFKILVECEAVELVRTEPVRGALEHFYRASMSTVLDEKHWRRLPQVVRDQLFDQTVQQIWEHTAAAADKGGFKDPRVAVAWDLLEFDDQAFDQMNTAIEGLIELGNKLSSESMARVAASDAEGSDLHRTELAVLHFHRA